MRARGIRSPDAPGGADTPDLDSLHADMAGPGYSYDTNQRLLRIRREDCAGQDASSHRAVAFPAPAARPRYRSRGMGVSGRGHKLSLMHRGPLGLGSMARQPLLSCFLGWHVEPMLDRAVIFAGHLQREDLAYQC